MKSRANARTHTMKRELLEEGIGLTLARALEIAENCENRLTTCAMSLDGKGEDLATVNRIYTGLRFRRVMARNENQPRDTLERTGRTPVIDVAMHVHFGRDPGCPARGQSCHTSG